MSDKQTYAGNNHLVGPGIHISVGNPSVILKYRGQSWCVEWHYYCGPTALHKRTGDVLKNQPGPRSPFWRVAQWWHDQGCKVVDGVGVWVEPEIVETRWTRVNKSNLISDPKGDVVLRFWKGYEAWGSVK